MNSIEQKIEKSGVLVCKHGEMLISLISLFIDLKQSKQLGSDFALFASQVVEIIANIRCKKEELKDSYKYFILNKIKIAYEVASLSAISESELSDDVLDIPVEEFDDAFTDHDFLELVGYNE